MIDFRKILELRKNNQGITVANGMVVPVYLFHGTSTVRVKDIEKCGLLYSFFSGSYKVAKGWANIRSSEEGGKPVIYYLDMRDNLDLEFERVPFTNNLKSEDKINLPKLIKIGKLEGFLLNL